ncbi:MAG TPA: EamA family transporter [Stellaceae bacterium]|nr:EamA family transporter [Stellaceae bacterium]
MTSLAPYYAALLVGICIAAGGQLLLKTGAMREAEAVRQFLDIFTILGLGAYGTSAVLYIFALRKIPLSQAYPTVSLSYLVVALAAHYFWGERISWGQGAGFLLILGGIFLVHRA